VNHLLTWFFIDDWGLIQANISVRTCDRAGLFGISIVGFDIYGKILSTKNY